MKRKIKMRGISLVLAAGILLGGCANQSGTEANTQTPTTQSTTAEEVASTDTETAVSVETETEVEEPEDDKDPLGAYKETLTVKVGVQAPAASNRFMEGDDIDNNIWTRLYKDALNIDVVVDFAGKDYGDYETKLNMNIASGNMPDVFSVPLGMYHNLVKSDAIENLTPYYDYLCDFTANVYAGIPTVMDSITIDGNLYGLPNGVGQIGANFVFIRTDWMEKSGISEIKTFDDVLALAEFFALGDPDGNGVQDTFGIGISNTLFKWQYSTDIFMNAYGAFPNIWREKDGALVYGGVMDEMRAPLEALADMFSRGIIDPEFGVKGNDQVTTDFTAGKIGMYFGGGGAVATGIDFKMNNPDTDVKCFQIYDFNGNRIKEVVSGSAGMTWVVRKGFSNPEALIKLHNIRQYKLKPGEGTDPIYHTYTSPAGDVAINHVFGLRIQVDDPWANVEISENVQKMMAENVPFDENNKESAMANYGHILNYQSDPTNRSGWQMLRTYGPGGTFSFPREDYMNNVVNAFYGPSGQAMMDNWGALEKYALETIVKTIYGTTPISDFDAFVQNWYNMGGQDVTNEVNDWYKNK